MYGLVLVRQIVNSLNTAILFLSCSLSPSFIRSRSLGFHNMGGKLGTFLTPLVLFHFLKVGISSFFLFFLVATLVQAGLFCLLDLGPKGSRPKTGGAETFSCLDESVPSQMQLTTQH